MVRLKGLNLKYISAVIIRLNVIIYIYFLQREHILHWFSPRVQLTMSVIWLAHLLLSVYFREKEKVLLMTNFSSHMGEVRSMLLVTVYSACYLSAHHATPWLSTLSWLCDVVRYGTTRCCDTAGLQELQMTQMGVEITRTKSDVCWEISSADRWTCVFGFMRKQG